MALTQNEKPIYSTIPNVDGNTFINASGAGAFAADTNGKALYTGATHGSMVEIIQICSNDTAARDMWLYILDGATVHFLGIINIPINAGGATNILAVNGLDTSIIKGLAYDNTGKAYIPLKAGAVLKGSMVAAVTTAKTVSVTVVGLDTV